MESSDEEEKAPLKLVGDPLDIMNDKFPQMLNGKLFNYIEGRSKKVYTSSKEILLQLI